jgi:hypothetical protein
MTSAIIKILIGLFIWIVVPQLLFKKKSKKKAPFKQFTFLVCKIISIIIIILGGYNLVQFIFGI